MRISGFSVSGFPVSGFRIPGFRITGLPVSGHTSSRGQNKIRAKYLRALKKNFGPMPLFHLFNVQTMHIKSINRAQQLSLKPYTYVHTQGFEPGPSVPDAMSTTPCRNIF
jgi:hypothetical protein